MATSYLLFEIADLKLADCVDRSIRNNLIPFGLGKFLKTYLPLIYLNHIQESRFRSAFLFTGRLHKRKL